MAEDRFPTISRRNVLTTTGAVVTGGAVVAFGSSGTASASVEATPLDIPDAVHEGEDGTVSGITVAVEGQYQYTVNEADEYLLTLMIASEPGADDWQAIDQAGDFSMSASTAGQYNLSGSVLDHDSLSADMFSADAGETVTREVPVMVALDVLHGGEVAVSALAETTAQVEVTSTAVAVSAEIAGSGQIDVAV